MRQMKNSGIEWIGEIPDAWGIDKCNRVFQIIGSGTTPRGEDIFENGTENWLQSGDVKEGLITICKNKLKKQVLQDFNALKKYEAPFIIIAMYGASVGNIAISQIDACVNQACCVLGLPKSNFKFLYYALLSTKDFLIKKALGGGQPNISQEIIRQLWLPKPSSIIQQKIADFLDDKCAKIDSLIAHEEATIEELKAYKQSVITEAVTKGLDKSVPMKDSGVEWIGKIPESWEILRIKNLGWTQNGISKSGDFFGQGYPFVSYGDVYKNMVLPRTVNGLIETTEQERNNYSVKENDIFFTRTSETIEEVGFSCVCKETIPNATFAGFLIRLRLFEDKKIQIDYAKYYFRGIQIRNYLVKEMNLVTRASLGQDLLKAMSVTLPPMIEQQQIADYLDKKCADIDSLISIKQQKIEELKEYKKSLIYEYVTGKKEVA